MSCSPGNGVGLRDCKQHQLQHNPFLKEKNKKQNNPYIYIYICYLYTFPKNLRLFLPLDICI